MSIQAAIASLLHRCHRYPNEYLFPHRHPHLGRQHRGQAVRRRHLPGRDRLLPLAAGRPAVHPFLLPQVWRNRAAIRPHLGKVFVLGVLGMAMYQSLAYFAAGITSATNMGIILSLMPLMSLALSIAWLGQRLSHGALLGALVSFFGVLEVVSAGQPPAAAQGLNSGDLMMLVATLAYALYSFLLKKWQLRLPPMQLLYLQVLVAIVVLLPLFLLSPRPG
jgi:drug/metabolite transporter (DMT)-like permease